MTTNGYVLGGGWDKHLQDQLTQPYWQELMDFVSKERGDAATGGYDVYPPENQVFRAFELTPYDDVKVVILGQDPYPNRGQAHGLAFSVPVEWQPLPLSLQNIRKVLLDDADANVSALPEHGSLEGWAEQGVLLLNTALTVRDGSKAQRDSHRRKHFDGKGWATFTDAVIRAVNQETDTVVFMLWGNDAKRKKRLITNDRHRVIESSHPSPRSARRSFLDSRPFSEANDALRGREINWSRLGQ